MRLAYVCFTLFSFLKITFRTAIPLFEAMSPPRENQKTLCKLSIASGVFCVLLATANIHFVYTQETEAVKTKIFSPRTNIIILPDDGLNFKF